MLQSSSWGGVVLPAGGAGGFSLVRGVCLVGGVLPAGGGGVLGTGAGGSARSRGGSPCWGVSAWSRGEGSPCQEVSLVLGGVFSLPGGFSLVPGGSAWSGGVLPAGGRYGWYLPGPGGVLRRPPLCTESQTRVKTVVKLAVSVSISV